MAPFPGDAVQAGELAALHHDSAADARAQNHAKHRLATPGRSELCLRERKAIGVVGEARFNAERDRQVATERSAIQANRVGVFQQAGRRLEHAWRADSNHRRTLAAGRDLQSPDEFAHTPNDYFVAQLRIGRPAQSADYSS